MVLGGRGGFLGSCVGGGGGANKERFFDSRLDDINKNCLEAFRKHWECLDQNNQQLWQCRRREMKLNGCVFDKLVSLSLLPSPPPPPFSELSCPAKNPD